MAHPLPRDIEKQVIVYKVPSTGLACGRDPWGVDIKYFFCYLRRKVSSRSRAQISHLHTHRFFFKPNSDSWLLRLAELDHWKTLFLLSRRQRGCCYIPTPNTGIHTWSSHLMQLQSCPFCSLGGNRQSLTPFRMACCKQWQHLLHLITHTWMSTMAPYSLPWTRISEHQPMATTNTLVH